ncbi:hemolysin [Okibacterium endophyticum]
MAPTRLDAALSERGLARSRTAAAQLIAAGLVKVDGHAVAKASLRVTDEQVIEVAGADHYVSRGAHKLNAALDSFGVDVTGRTALDVGASTGGFTQVLLERGAEPVIALDVGHGQLAPLIRQDERVVTVEGFNVRDLSAQSLAAASGVVAVPDLVVADLSFISLTLVLEPIAASVARGADLVLLIKPQFEVGRSGIREGIVRAAQLRAEALEAVLWSAWDIGLGTAGLIPSPIAGGHGNLEYLVWLKRTTGHGNPTEWMKQITQMAGVSP